VDNYTTDWASKHYDNWLTWLGHLKGRSGVRGLEIGTYEGRSAAWFASNILTGSDSYLICIDPFTSQNRLNRFMANTDGMPVHQVAGHSQDVLRGMRKEFDFVYIDGNHDSRFVIDDAVQSFRLCKVGGVIIFDDYKLPGGPAKAVDAFLDIFSENIEVVSIGGQVCIKVERKP
jgi:predicted O-methyltransferase YrrM